MGLKKYIWWLNTGILIAALGFLTGIANAQQNENQNPQTGGKLETLKIGYITTRLNLSTEEAQKFWPIYNQYSREIKETRKNGGLTDIQLDEAILNIRKKYNSQFTTAMPPAKVDQFFRSEKEFNNFVRKEWMERTQQRRMQQQRRPFGNRP